MLIAGRLQRIRAVGKGADYEMTFDGTADLARKAARVYLDRDVPQLDREIRDEFTAAIARGTLNFDEANSLHQHELWTRFVAPHPDFGYVRTLLPDVE